MEYDKPIKTNTDIDTKVYLLWKHSGCTFFHGMENIVFFCREIV